MVEIQKVLSTLPRPERPSSMLLSLKKRRGSVLRWNLRWIDIPETADTTR